MTVKKQNANGSPNGVAELKPIKIRNKTTSLKTNLVDTERAHRLADVPDNKELLRILTEVKNGNFTVRMPIDQTGLNGKICDTLNEIIALNEKMMQEFTHAGNTIG